MHDLVISAETVSLEFIRPARTSRGEYTEKKVTLIHLSDGKKKGTGEASPLPDLSIDGQADLPAIVSEIREIPYEFWNEKLEKFPSLQFAIECAELELSSENGILFESEFTKGKIGIPINGLVWMNDFSAMEAELEKKISDGFRCIKIKTGQHDHDGECRFLEKIRKKYNAFFLELRLDANGAYEYGDATQKLKDLSRFDIHSIEQPIRAGQWEQMHEVCRNSKIPVALDEELIGISSSDFDALLNTIRPSYIILKPTLIGGFRKCDLWIEKALKYNIGWWATSALESNLGLAHIAQWTASKNPVIPQGLGTGGLYKNNLPSRLELRGENLWFSQ